MGINPFVWNILFIYATEKFLLTPLICKSLDSYILFSGVKQVWQRPGLRPDAKGFGDIGLVALVEVDLLPDTCSPGPPPAPPLPCPPPPAAASRWRASTRSWPARTPAPGGREPTNFTQVFLTKNTNRFQQKVLYARETPWFTDTVSLLL